MALSRRGRWAAGLEGARAGAAAVAARTAALKAPVLTTGLFLVLLVYLLAQPQSAVLDLDTGWLIKSGEIIRQQGRLPAGDVFSFTQGGRPWVLYQWGFELYVAGLHALAGLGGVIWGAALLIALTYALLLAFLLRLGLSRVVSLGLVLLAILVNNFCWYSRPGTFSILAYMALLGKLETWRHDPGVRLWDLAVLFFIWANLHLGFVLGLAVLLLYALWAFLAPGAFRGAGSPRDRRGLMLWPLCLGAACLNPYGPGLLSYFWQLAHAGVMNAAIIELRSPDFHLPPMYFLFLQVVLLLWLGGGDYPGRGLLLTLVTLTMALAFYAMRNIPFFSLTATLHLGYCLERRFPHPQSSPDRPGLRRRWAAGAAAGAVLALLWVTIIETRRPGFYNFDERLAPAGAAAALLRQGPGPQPYKVFVQDAQWASYLIYRLYPRAQMFIDSRFDMYGDRFFALFQTLQKEAGSNPDILRRWGVDTLVLKKARLSSRPRPQPHWVLMHEDGQSLVYRYQPREAATPPEPYNPYR